MVVGCTDLVALLVRQLQLNGVVGITLLMQDGRSHATKPVARHTALVAHALQGFQDRVVAHGLVMIALAREQQHTPARQGVQHLHHLHGLRRQRHDVGGFHLHALRRNAPLCSLQVELCPARRNQFGRAYKREGHQLHGQARVRPALVCLDFAQQLGQLFFTKAGVVLFAAAFEGV